MISSRDRTLIVGVGNLLLGDEGLGVHVAQALMAAPTRLPAGVDVIDAGTSLLDVLGELPRYDRVIIVDAMQCGDEPGAIRMLEIPDPTALRRGAPVASLHQLELLDALAAAADLGLLPADLILIGAEVQSVSPGIALSSSCAVAAGRIVEWLRTREARDGRPRMSRQGRP